jgi:hypothetical protein
MVTKLFLQLGYFKFSTKRNIKFITQGFDSWHKALEKFKEHQKTDCHQEALYKANASRCDVLLDKALVGEKAKNTKMLQKLITSVCYLAKQGQGLRGTTHAKVEGTDVCEPDSNLQQLLQLRSDDVPELAGWLKRKIAFTSPAIQNEILDLVAKELLRQLLAKIGQRWFCIMADETTDISNQQQLAFVVRHVDDELTPHETLIGLYHIPNAKADTIVSVINDVLLRCSLQIENLRGQCYDGASVMSGRLNGVAAQLREWQPKATYIHCFAHSLNLSVQDMAPQNSLLKNMLSREKIKEQIYTY